MATASTPRLCSHERVSSRARAVGLSAPRTTSRTRLPPMSVSTLMKSCPLPKLFSSIPRSAMSSSSRRARPRSTARCMMFRAESQLRRRRRRASSILRLASITASASASKASVQRLPAPAHGTATISVVPVFGSRTRGTLAMITLSYCQKSRWRQRRSSWLWMWRRRPLFGSIQSVVSQPTLRMAVRVV